MRALVTGAGGMLARAVIPALERAGAEVTATTRAELDVTDPAAVRARVRALRPGLVVQCAAFTAVDRAEVEEAEAHRVNAAATEHLAAACQEVGALIVYPSSDYVFAGTGERPYRPDDVVRPVNAYGRSKAAGEAAARRCARHLVVRTSWLYGEGGGNFVETMLRLAREQPRLRVVDDQIGRPTWTLTVADAIVALAAAGATGVHHVSDGGKPVSWCGFARAVLELAEVATLVDPVATAEFPRPAPRPAYSVLDCSRTEALLGRRLPEWRDSLASYLAQRAQPLAG